MTGLLDIIHEDAALLVVNKPADLVCHPTKGDASSSLIGRLRQHLGEGTVPRLVNRLDRETSGVVLAAKDAATARELGRLWETREVHKEYLAIVHGHVVEETGLIEAALGPDLASPVVIKNSVTSSGQKARTEFQTLRRFSRAGADYSLLRVLPHTGRKHQIRIHLAHRGHPIVGDKIYGPDEHIYLRFVRGQMTDQDRGRLVLPHQALQAGEVRFTWRDRAWCFQARPESWFMEFVLPDGLDH